jgi:hypothetical protein
MEAAGIDRCVGGFDRTAGVPSIWGWMARPSGARPPAWEFARALCSHRGRAASRGGRLARREPALAALEPQPVEALKMSLLPKLAGQSPSGHGAGNTRCPAVNDAWRQASMAGQSAVRRVSVQTPAPYVRVAIA